MTTHNGPPVGHSTVKIHISEPFHPLVAAQRQLPRILHFFRFIACNPSLHVIFLLD